MKSLVKFVCCFSATLSSVALANISITESLDEIVYHVQVEGLDMVPISIGSKNFVEAKLQGVADYSAVNFALGQPELPVIRMILDGEVSVEVGSREISGALKSNMYIKPSQPSWDKNKSEPPPLVFNQDAYAIDDFTLRPSFLVEDVGSFRGVSRRMITLHAMNYNPVRGIYKIVTDYKIKVKRRAEPIEQAPTLAFIVGQQFAKSPSVERLKSIKQSQGYEVKVYVVGEELEESPVSIRNALRSLYDQGLNLRFAILIGDVADIPAHDSNYIFGVTDHYYRCIDTEDYESDINAPDIGVGRISVSNERELGIVVQKIESYAYGSFGNNKEQLNQDDSWLRHPAFIATRDRYQVAEATHDTVIKDFFEPRGYLSEFPTRSEKGGDRLYPISLGATKSQIYHNISGGRFIINFSGHGSYSGWEDVTTEDVKSFKHRSALPWVLSNSCITGDFRQEPVFAETWLRHPHGAITFWGSMDSTYWDEDDILERAAYRMVFDEHVRAFDSVHQAALSEVWRYYGGKNRSKYYRETYVTFGDPSLTLRLDRPQKVQLFGPDYLIRGQRSVTFSVNNNGVPESGAMIVLRRGSGGPVVTAVTNKDGVASVSTEQFTDVDEPVQLHVFGPDLESIRRDFEINASEID